MLASLRAVAPYVLHAYWALATSAALIAAVPIEGMQAFRHAVQLAAARGKLWGDRPAVNLGPLTDAAVPQRWFTHFYLLGSACNAACICWFLDHLGRQPTLLAQQCASLVALAALQCHLLRRWYETERVMVYPPQARMHFIAYAFGLSYYGLLGLSLLHSADLATMLQQPPPLQDVSARRMLAQLARLDWQQCLGSWAVLGLLVFAGGNLLQNQSHRILAALSPASSTKSSQQEVYKIPRGGAFEWLSCPHYLAEIVIYVGLLLVLRGRHVNAWLILSWVVCNLVLAAQATHRWYRKKFEDYPTHRRALIPYVL